MQQLDFWEVRQEIMMNQNTQSTGVTYLYANTVFLHRGSPILSSVWGEYLLQIYFLYVPSSDVFRQSTVICQIGFDDLPHDV